MTVEYTSIWQARINKCTRDRVTRLWSRQWLCLLAVGHSTHQHGIHGCTGDTFSKHTTIIINLPPVALVWHATVRRLFQEMCSSQISSHITAHPEILNPTRVICTFASFYCGVVTLACTWLSLYACMVDDRQEIKQVEIMWQLNTLAEHMSGIIGLASWAWRHLAFEAWRPRTQTL